jgi:hypothetical protein
MKKIIILMIVILLLVNFVSAEEIQANNLRYVYKQAPDSLAIGSRICFGEANEICAPVLSFNIPETNDNNIKIEVTTNQEINIQGTACILNNYEVDTWTNVMQSLTTICKPFQSVNNKIMFVLQPTTIEEQIRIVLIPGTGSGSADIDSAKLTLYNIAEQEEEQPIQTEINECFIETINFDKIEGNVNLPMELVLNTNQCENSIVRIIVHKKTLTGEKIVSEKQSLITGNVITSFWIPTEKGEYYAKAESKNLIQSETINIIDESIQELMKNKEFYEIVDEVHKISKVNENLALKTCEDLRTTLEQDVCIEDLASYTSNKLLCSKIDNQNRKESCYSLFALQGDITSCIHSSSKATCLLLGIFAKTNNLSLKQNDKYEDVIALKENKSNSLIIILIIVVIVLIVATVLYFGFYDKNMLKNHK